MPVVPWSVVPPDPSCRFPTPLKIRVEHTVHSYTAQSTHNIAQQSLYYIDVMIHAFILTHSKLLPAHGIKFARRLFAFLLGGYQFIYYLERDPILSHPSEPRLTPRDQTHIFLQIKTTPYGWLLNVHIPAIFADEHTHNHKALRDITETCTNPLRVCIAPVSCGIAPTSLGVTSRSVIPMSTLTWY